MSLVVLALDLVVLDSGFRLVEFGFRGLGIMVVLLVL